MSVRNVLLIDDDPVFGRAVRELLADDGYVVDVAETLAEAREVAQEREPAATLIDLMLPDGNGLDFIEERGHQLGRVVVITGHASVEAAVRSLRAQVEDFLVKPVKPERIKTCLDGLADPSGAGSNAHDVLDRLLLGESGAIQEVKKSIRGVAASEAPVFIRGETGTGKEVVAKAIHALSERSDQPFLAVNCGAFAKELLASELFGHERGSFTGAAQRHRGFFERAEGGTLFLDEITEMSAELQVLLLRVLEEHRFRRVGGESELEADVRLITASNRGIREAFQSEALREDLYYRLNVFPIELPPLRQREGDVRLLATHFLLALNERQGAAKHFSADALDALEARPWPGNVRELRNLVWRAWLVAENEITRDDLADPEPAGQDALRDIGRAAGYPIKEVERRLIEATLDKLDGDKRAAAKALGISLKTLYNRLNEYTELASTGSRDA